MSHDNPEPLRYSEHDITGQNLIAVVDNPRIRIAAPQETNSGEAVYSVTSLMELDRDNLPPLLSRPIGETATWQQIRQGLRDISYPKRRIKQLYRSAQDSRYLASIGPASRELADLLDRNDNEKDVEVTVPVFSYQEAIEYVERQLTSIDPRRVYRYLKKLDRDADDTYDRLELLAGETDLTDNSFPFLGSDEQRQIVNRAMLAETSGLTQVEAIHTMLDRNFVGYREKPMLEVEPVKPGNDNAIYLRVNDIPEQILNKWPSVIRVVQGEELRDPDRKTGRSRRKIKFTVRQDQLVASPRISWAKDREGISRRFVFPTSLSESSSPLASSTIRPSSLAGAALAAGWFGREYGVDYSKDLDKVLYQNHFSKYVLPLARVGLFALVLRSGQERILSNQYFRAIEAEADKIQ